MTYPRPFTRRRLMLAGGSGLLAASLPSTAIAGQPAQNTAERSVILAGANPGVRLFEDDVLTAYASVWQVDWSTHGSGTAVVLWHDGVVRVLSSHPELAEWLESYFTRHFPEVEGLPWPRPTVERRHVRVDIDLEHGMSARAGDVAIRMTGVLDRRVSITDEFDLDGQQHSLVNLFVPCAEAEIRVRGRRLPGSVTRTGTPERPSSTAFLATEEVWQV